VKELIEIQNKLKVPKSLENSFGGFMYRSAEAILEKVKPLLVESDCQLILTDDIKECGGRVYIEASAIFTAPGGETVTCKALAREPDQKKGMDSSQITGSASSYARKYALSGLFLLDDNKDADGVNNADDVRGGATEQQKNDLEQWVAFFESKGNQKDADFVRSRIDKCSMAEAATLMKKFHRENS